MIFTQDETGIVGLDVQAFEKEADLEEALAAIPALLSSSADEKIATVARQVGLEAGFADIPLLDSFYRPIIVEVKLGRNGGSRREVVGQIFDYVSTVAEMTFEELDEAVNGRLSTTISEAFAFEKEGEMIERARVQCAANLRSGNVRIVIAVDEAPSELVRIVRYVADKSYVDVRLVEIDRYKDGSGRNIFVPSILVGSEAGKPLSAPANITTDILQAVVSRYDETAPTSLMTRGRGASFRQIRFDPKVGLVHYEFMHHRSSHTFGVELHVEDEKFANVTRALPNLLTKLNGKYTGCELRYDPKWVRGCGRLQLIFPEGSDAGQIAHAMTQFITDTRVEVEALVTQ